MQTQPTLPDALLALGKITHPQCDVSFSERAHQQSPIHTHDTSNHVLVVHHPCPHATRRAL